VMIVGYYYDLRNARIASVETIASEDALVEKLTVVFESLDTIYFDASGNSSMITTASWSAPGKERPETPRLVFRQLPRKRIELTYLGCLVSNQKTILSQLFLSQLWGSVVR
jgi:hypothetical protein